jgi:hypothetical protein
MKYILQMNLTSRGMQYTMTNVVYLHTWSVGNVNLIATVVSIADGQLLQVAGDVISCPRVDVPVGVHTVW